ncbi:MAG TPA: LysM peptidoglycan-binding domain-containing protein [Myxococcales bacterium]|nr:LysM peptidoglycan-binding domain-containing protein [Myxococcales bacterium]
MALSAPEASFAPDSFGTHVYTVQSGDTLWGISQQFGTTVAHLRELNPAVQGTDVIYPGQQLVVPGSSGPPETGGQTQSYTIRSGDTMGAIAAAHGTTVDQLMRLNPWITNPNYIQAGWVIQVPAFTPAPPPPNPGPVPPGPFPPGPLTTEPNHQFSLGETWPYIKQYANQYGFDPHVLAGMVQQESGFKNYQVHFDGTGHGLLGLDDNGLLPDFEGWVRRTKPGQENYSAGRGAGASSIPPDWQLEYAAQKLASYKNTFGGGDDYAAARAWYRGPGGMNDSLGYHYQSLIQAHVSQLFANGDPPDQLPGPVPPPPPQPLPNGPIRSVDQANQFFLSQWGPTPYNSGGWPYGFNDCGPTSAAMVAEAVGLWPPSGPGGASATIDRMRDTILGYDSTYSQLMNTTQLASGLRSAGAATQMLYNADPVASVEEALGRGHPAILGGSGVWNAWGAQQRAAGNYLNSRDPGGHFVTVMGKSDDGRYIVGDPLVRNGAITVTADQLRTYMSNGFGVLEAWNPNAVPPPPPPPQPAKATFQTVTGNYMSAQNGGLNGAGTGPGANEQFDMSDLDGGDLRSGDYINLKSSAGLYVCAEFGGGQEVNANRPAAAEWERLKIVEIGGDGIIQDGDRVAFQTSDGQHWLIAQHGGGDNINSDSTIPGYFETFTYRKG